MIDSICLGGTLVPTLPLLLVTLRRTDSVSTTGWRCHWRADPFDSWLVRSLDLSTGLVKWGVVLAIRLTVLVLTLTRVLPSVYSEW